MTALIVDSIQIVLSLIVITLLATGRRRSKRVAHREELALMAVDYTEMMASAPYFDKRQRITTAISAFGKMDQADNGTRDYSDAEARIAIEAVLARRKAAAK